MKKKSTAIIPSEINVLAHIINSQFLCLKIIILSIF